MEERTPEPCACGNENLTCTSVTSQYADVCLPLKLKPYAVVEKLATECCGEPVVALRQGQDANCPGGCEITITQTVCIRISLEYGTNLESGEATTACGKKSTGCSGCTSGYRRL